MYYNFTFDHCQQLGFAAVGFWIVIAWALQTIMQLRRFYKGHFTKPSVKFRDCGQYAVITGATDGIGKAYAFELAKYGMDIVVVSRTLSRLQSTTAELKQKFPACSVKMIVANYGKTDIYEHLERELADIDVGILVNNVGEQVATPLKLLSEMPRADVFRMINVNIVSVVLTSQVVLPKMVAKGRGVVINISSATAFLPPFKLLYATAKSFMRRFSYGLRLQHQDLGICVQDVEPFYVTTKLTNFNKELGAIDPETCAQQSLRTVGHYDETCGAISHDIQGFIYSLLPDSVMLALMRANSASPPKPPAEEDNTHRN